MSAPGRGRAAGGVGWVGFLVLVVAGLHALGGALSPPPLTAPGELPGWLAQREPAEAAFATLRLLALAAAWYLLVVTLVAAAGRLLRLRPLTAAADAVTLPGVRRLVNAMLGVSISATTLTGSAGAAWAGPPGTAGPGAGEVPAVETMRWLPDAGPPAPPLTMRRLPAAPVPPVTAPGPRPLAPPVSAPAPPPPAAPATPGQWTVRRDQHFWGVAERVLADAWQRPPSPAQVHGYWRRLVEANRARLRDPDRPDRLFPGQVLVVPPPPEPPR